MKKIFIFCFCLAFLFSCQNKEIEAPNVKTKEQVQECSESNNPLMQCKQDIQKTTVSFLKQPKQIEKLGFLQTNTEFFQAYSENDTDTKYYKIGDFHREGKKGELFLLQAKYVYTSSKLYFAKIDGKYYFLESISSNSFGDTKTEAKKDFTSKVEKEKKEEIETFLQPYFQLPKEISFKKDDIEYKLKLQRNLGFLFNETNLEKIDFIDGDFYIETQEKHSWGSDLYKKYKKLQNDNYKQFEKLDQKIKDKYWEEDYKISTFTNKGIYKKLPDGTMAIYSLQVPFETKKVDEEGNKAWGNIFDIQLKNNSKKIENYHYKGNTSCSGNYILDLGGKLEFFVQNKNWKEGEPLTIPITGTYTEKDLEVIGSNTFGQEIYGFTDKNHSFLKKHYESYKSSGGKYSAQGKFKQMSYKEFVNDYPIFFWRDPFGRLIAFIKFKTVMDLENVCAGKPVIYLYPKTQQQVSVSLDWKKKNLISIPKYEDSWEVTANPNGDIETNGRKYPYLFWEDSIDLQKKTDGFIVKKENIGKFLEEKLTFLGLNEKERADFMDFWLEKMQENNYYFIRFYGNETMNKIAPITITPTPDSIQRVFMDYKGLDKRIEVKKQVLQPFKRTGFSVIEWGGNLQ